MRNDDGADYRPTLTKKFVEQARLNNAARDRERELVARLGKELDEKVKERLNQAIDHFFQKEEARLLDFAIRIGAADKNWDEIKELHSQYARIERRLCAVFHVTPNEIRSHRRSKEIMLARQAVMYWAVRLTGYSYPKIGRIMGGRDHTSIMYGATAYRKKREKMGRYLRKAR